MGRDDGASADRNIQPTVSAWDLVICATVQLGSALGREHGAALDRAVSCRTTGGICNHNELPRLQWLVCGINRSLYIKHYVCV